MATKRVCDRCGAEISPFNPVTYAGMRRTKNDINDNDYELCVSCANKLRKWFNGEEKEKNVMDAVKFLNGRHRTCDSYPGCNGCELKGKPCPGYVTYAPFSATQYERVKPNENAVKKESSE